MKYEFLTTPFSCSLSLIHLQKERKPLSKPEKEDLLSCFVFLIDSYCNSFTPSLQCCVRLASSLWNHDIRQLAQNFLMSVISWLGSGLKKPQASQGSKPQKEGTEGSWTPLLRMEGGFAVGIVTGWCSSGPHLVRESALNCCTTACWPATGLLALSPQLTGEVGEKRENTNVYAFTYTFKLALKCSFGFRYALRDTDV